MVLTKVILGSGSEKIKKILDKKIDNIIHCDTVKVGGHLISGGF